MSKPMSREKIGREGWCCGYSIGLLEGGQDSKGVLVGGEPGVKWNDLKSGLGSRGLGRRSLRSGGIGRGFGEASDAIDDGNHAEDIVRRTRDADDLHVAAEEDLPVGALFVAIIHDKRGDNVSGGLGPDVNALGHHASPLEVLGHSAAGIGAVLPHVRGLPCLPEVSRMFFRGLLDFLAVHKDGQRLLLAHKLDRVVVLPISPSLTALAPS